MIDLSVAKLHCRVLHDREDTLIQTYIEAALSAFEDHTGRKLYADEAALAQDQDAPEHTAIIDSKITAGALLLVGYLYSTRDMDNTMPQATERLWQPYKVFFGG
tara:strand:- start:510 stop:821 length:312 start_codon:yes stop_codon:yes gene_type:complete